jgi:hypothetical protein
MFDVEAAMAKTIADHHAQFPGAAHRPTGPKTEAGKQRTRLNAYKHGLTGQIHLFSVADQESYDLHCAGIVAALAPVGALEIDLPEAIAQNRWRLKRVAAIESGIFAAGHNGQLVAQATPFRTDPADVPYDDALSQARTWLTKSGDFQLLALYQQRINRTIERNMVELRTLRAERKAALDQALEEALLLAQHAQSKGEKYNPARDFPPELLGIGSVFSEAAIARYRRLREARDHAKSGTRSAAAA